MLKTFLFALLVVWSAAASAAGTILVLGDSLSAAYGIGQKEGWVTLLQERLRARKFDYTVVNASISGETSAGGAARIDAALERVRPQVLVLQLGGNDGLRGLSVAQMKQNLAAIIRAAQKRNARVLVIGMRMPPNYGPKYTQAFQQAYADLAREFKTALVPFLLEGIGDRQEYFLQDQIHPSAVAQPILLDTVWNGLEPLLRKR